MIICNQCGFEFNPDGSDTCEICSCSLTEEMPVEANPVQETVSVPDEVSGDAEYFVLCPESSTKTVVSGEDVTTYFCEGCRKNHEIDGLLWVIEKNIKAPECETTQAEQVSDNLFLEDVSSHYRISIGKEGGTIGRYGTFGADFFNRNNLLTVSGEHCRIRYENGNWILQHISRTNDTHYNDMKLERGEERIIENGRTLTLSRKISFIIRIE